MNLYSIDLAVSTTNRRMDTEMNSPQKEVQEKRKELAISTESALVSFQRPPGKRQKTDGDQKDGRAAADEPTVEYFHKRAYQVEAEVNPNYILELRATHELGFTRQFSQWKPKIIYVELIPENMRTLISSTLAASFAQRFIRSGNLRINMITSILKDIVPVTCDAIMAATYAKLRYIHKLHGEHQQRYSGSPSYNKDIELPFPFAIAIQDLGIVESQDTEDKSLYLPDFPEGTANEGRKETKWSAFTYQSYIPMMKENGVIFKSVNPHLKVGSAWWTLKVEKQRNTVDLICTLPPLHYTPQSVATRALFLDTSKAPADTQIIKTDNLPLDYGSYLREGGMGYNIRAFHALCQAPEEDWNPNMA
uniref:Coat protein 2 n=1 Tax=Port Orford cedar deltapartitivirus TaxID=2933095 RepID=A0A9C7GWZ6_9VIRU|nr:putative coat protein 2 [Port Orford cedar deltapartitivirus]CAI5383879.1 putative coat protein 2 [Port Orford cedar deltapartitivirus]